MNTFIANINFSLILLISTLLFSCNGQFKTNAPQDNSAESNLAITDTSVQPITQQVDTPWVDPLFFIEGQLCQHVRHIFQDSRGDLWFGTNVYDLMRYNGDSLEYFSEKDGIGGGRITGIVEDKEGNVWFGTYRGLSKYDPSATNGKAFTNFSEEDGLVHHEVWSVLLDSKGIFWIGTTEGLSRFDPLATSEEAFTTIPIPKATVTDTTTIYAHNRISCIMEDQNGILWLGSDGFGICKYDHSAKLKAGRNTFTYITKEDGLPDNNISGLMKDTKGNIWIGTMFGGISMYDGRSFTNFTQDSVIKGIEVGGFLEDKKGSIWFAAENYGVYRYRGGTFTNLYKKEGLPTNGILSILEDREGRFWFGGWGGLFRYRDGAFVSVTKDGPWGE